MSTAKDRLKQLIAQRELLELEANAIKSELISPGPEGQPPAGIKEPLVDSAGFPRGDIDIYNVRRKRNRLAVINTDYSEVMMNIEKVMQMIYSEQPESPLVTSNDGNTVASNDLSQQPSALSPIEDNSILANVKSLLPIATIDEVLEGSPAETAGLQNGDKLIAFSHITSNSADALISIPAVVRENIGKPIQIFIRRNNENISIILVPKVWGGRGVLGCHLTPIMT